MPSVGPRRSASVSGVEPTGRPRVGGTSTGSNSAYRQIPGLRAAIASRVNVRAATA